MNNERDFDSSALSNDGSPIKLNNSVEFIEKSKFYLLTGLAAAELSPINEMLRLGAFGIGEGFSRSPIAGAISYGLSTFIVESAGALSAASLFDTKESKATFEWLNKKLKKMNITENDVFSLKAKALIAMMGGSVVSMAIGERENPQMTLEENRKYGLRISALLAGACALQGALMSTGIDIGIKHPEDALGLGFGMVGLYAAGKATKNKMKSRRITEDYSSLISENLGPQKEGIPLDILKVALKNKDVIFIEDKNKAKIPFLVPVEYAPWINKAYFESRSKNNNQLLYCILPQKDVSKFDISNIEKVMSESLDNYEGIVFDYLENTSEFESIDKFSIDHLLTDNKSEAATYHYHLKLAEGDKLHEYVPNAHVIEINKDNLLDYFDDIWNIYNLRFDELIKDHPIKGSLNKQELMEVLSSSDVYIKAYIDTNNSVKSFGYIVGDFELCDWLDKTYMESKRTTPFMGYFSGIASDYDASPMAANILMKEFLYDFLNEYHTVDLFYECSNKSAQYIPKLLEYSIKRSGIAKCTESSEIKYYYNLLTK